MSTIDGDAALAEEMLGEPIMPVRERVEPPAPVESQDRPEPENHTPPDFDERWREPFSGLLYLGSLSTSVTIWGHDFLLATPSQTERMQIGPLIKDYIDTVSGPLAYSTAFVAASLVEIDGRPLPRPVTNDPKENALAGRFRWVQHNMHKPVVDELYSRALELDMTVQHVLEAMGKV